MNPGGRGPHPTAQESNLFMSSRPGAVRGGYGSSTVSGAARAYPAPPRPLQHSPPSGIANGGSHSPVSHSPTFGAPSPQNEVANHGPLANGIRPRAVSGPGGARLSGVPIRSGSPLPFQADASDPLRPRIDQAVEAFCGVSNVLREQADEAAAFTFPDLAQDEADELRNKFDEARRKRSLERQETINRAYGNIAQMLQEVMESYVARALRPHVEVMRQSAAAVDDLQGKFNQLTTEVDVLRKTVASQPRPAPPTGPSASRFPPNLPPPAHTAGSVVSASALTQVEKLAKDVAECEAHLNAVKKQVGADQEKLGKLSQLEPRIATLEKQASQTTDPRRRPASAAEHATPPHPSAQPSAEMQKTVEDVRDRVVQLESRVGLVGELEKKVADVQLKVDEVAKSVETKKDADDMEIDNDSGEKLSVLEKRLEEVREEWVKQVAAVKDDVDKVSSRKTVPPEHVPLVASLANFAAAGQADLSSDELASRLENGLRGWDAGLGSHETRLAELSNKLDEHCTASDKRFVAAGDLARAHLPLASNIATYLRRGQIRGRFPTPQEIGFPESFRLDDPAVAASRQTTPARSNSQHPVGSTSAATSPQPPAQASNAASPAAYGGGSGNGSGGS